MTTIVDGSSRSAGTSVLVAASVLAHPERIKAMTVVRIPRTATSPISLTNLCLNPGISVLTSCSQPELSNLCLDYNTMLVNEANLRILATRAH